MFLFCTEPELQSFICNNCNIVLWQTEPFSCKLCSFRGKCFSELSYFGFSRAPKRMLWVAFPQTGVFVYIVNVYIASCIFRNLFFLSAYVSLTKTETSSTKHRSFGNCVSKKPAVVLFATCPHRTMSGHDFTLKTGRWFFFLTWQLAAHHWQSIQTYYCSWVCRQENRTSDLIIRLLVVWRSFTRLPGYLELKETHDQRGHAW